MNRAASESEGAEKRRNPRAVRAQILIASITAGVLVAIGGITVLGWPKTPAVGASAELPPGETSTEWLTYAEKSRTQVDTGLEHDLSAAMKKGDREAFLSHATGTGKEALARWWDGTKAIGWDLGFATTAGYGSDDRALLLGVQLAFSSHPAVGSGSADSGLVLTQNFRYSMTVSGDAKNEKITGLTPKIPMAWDESAIHVVKRPHVVIYGRADERALVEANADLAESAAKKTLDTLTALGGTAPVDGFVTAITDRQDSFDRWLGETEWKMDVAGFARATDRPSWNGGALPANIATGSESSGALVALGPKSTEGRESVFVHEFAHVLHDTALPQGGFYIDPSSPEGFAEYFEHAAGVGQPYFADPRVKAAVQEDGIGAFSEENLRGVDAGVAYSAAGSYYQFVADTGGSAWKLAMDRDDGLTMANRAKLQGAQFSEERWQEWVAAQ